MFLLSLHQPDSSDSRLPIAELSPRSSHSPGTSDPGKQEQIETEFALEWGQLADRMSFERTLPIGGSGSICVSWL